MRSFSTTTIRYQPTHVDVQVAGCVVSQHETNELQNKLYMEHIKRWNDLLKNFEKELDVCIKKQIRKHEDRILRKKENMKRELNQLFKYEAKEIRKDHWTFEKSPPESQPIAKLLISWRNVIEQDKLKTIKKCEEAQKDIAIYKQTCLTKQHQQEMNFRRLEWKVKAKDNWNRIETSILAAFEMEKRRREDRAKKRQEEAMKNKEKELQPKLDLLFQQRNVLTDKNQQLGQELNAMQIKHTSGLAIIDKLISSFQYFIMETMKVNEDEARKLSKQLLEKERGKEIST